MINLDLVRSFHFNNILFFTLQNVCDSLAAKATTPGFVFVSEVSSHAGGGGEGALTLVARKLLQILHNTTTYGIFIYSSKNLFF